MNRKTLLAVLIEKICDGLRLQGKLGPIGLVADGNDLRDMACLNLNYGSFVIVGIPTGIDFDAVRPRAIPPGLISTRLRIATAAQVSAISSARASWPSMISWGAA